MIDSGIRVCSLTFVPFLLLQKGAAVETLGFALALVFAGGATGKLVCGFIAEKVGILRTVVLTEVATGGLIACAILLPLEPTLVLLPLFGIALNGTSSVLYGTIGDFVDVPVPDTYSLIFVVFNTLFNLLTQEEQVRCFENVAAHLTDDGSFVVEAYVPAFLYRLRDHQYVDAEAINVDEVRLVGTGAAAGVGGDEPARGPAQPILDVQRPRK